jgi:hypothetical protein
MSDILYSLLNPKNEIRASGRIARALGVDTAFAFSALLEKHEECESKGKLDDEGFFFSSEVGLFGATTLKGAKQTKALKTLQNNGLIIVKMINDKRYVRITFDVNALHAVLQKGENEND